MPRGVEDRDRWIPGKSERRCKNASVGNRHAQFAAFRSPGHPAAREVMAPPHMHTHTYIHVRARWCTINAWSAEPSVVPSAVGVSCNTRDLARIASSSRGVRNNTLVVGAANSARNYPDARHLLGSCPPGRSPDGDNEVSDEARVRPLVVPPSDVTESRS